MNILTYAIHPDPASPMGGGFFRFIEILKRSKNSGINYIVVESRRTFKEVFRNLDYESYPIDATFDFYSLKSTIHCMIKALWRGLEVCRKKEIDLLYSPVEVHPSSLLPFFTHLLTDIPWTVMLNSVPLYGILHENCIASRKSLSFASFYNHLRFSRQFTIGQSLTGASVYRIFYYILRTTPKLLAIGKIVTRNFRTLDPIISQRLLEIGNGLDLDSISKISPQKKIYDAIFIPAADPRKGLFDIIDIWDQVADELDSCKLAVLGRIIGNPHLLERYFQTLKTRITQRSLNGKIVFEGTLRGFRREELWKKIKMGKVLLYPSRIDTWGLVLGEALASGVPVVAYDLKVFREAYPDCPSLFLVPVDDISAFARKTVKLIRNKNTLKKYSIMAQRYVAKYPTWDDILGTEKRAYFDVIRAWKH